MAGMASEREISRFGIDPGTGSDPARFCFFDARRLSMQSNQHQIVSLTGLRGVAAGWVMLMHFREITPTRVWKYPILDPLIANGAYGVDIFFVLSGFILCHVYADSFRNGVSVEQARQFILYRFARIYPVHLVTFAFMLVLLAVKLVTSGDTGLPGRYDPLTILTTLTLTHAWIPGIQTPNMPAWSISAEWLAYLLFPVLSYFISHIRGVMGLYFAIGLALAFFQPLGNYCLTHVLSGFLVGMAAYRAMPALSRIRIGRYTGFGLTAAIVLWAQGTAPPVAVGLLLFAVLIVVLASPRDMVSGVLSMRAIVYLGEISYSLYMVHWPARIVVRNALQTFGVLDSLPAPVVVSAYLVAALAAAVVSFHLVELPSRALLRRRSATGARADRLRA